MNHGSNSLAKADAAIVGGNKAVQQDVEAFGFEVVFDQSCQQVILEDAAGKSTGGKSSLSAGLLTGGGNAGSKACVKFVG